MLLGGSSNNPLSLFNLGAYGGNLYALGGDDEYTYSMNGQGEVAPEVTIYPNGNYSFTSLEGPTLGALNYMGVPYKKKNRELPLMDSFRTMPTNEEASHYADQVAKTTAPTVGDFIYAGVGKPLGIVNPLNWIAACMSNPNVKVKENNEGSSEPLSESNPVIINPSEEQISEYLDDTMSGNAYYQKGDNYVDSKLVYRYPNDSRTSTKSQELENKMYTVLDGYRNRVHYRTQPFDIPYGNREIIIHPKDEDFNRSLSVNALDSLAKYAGITGVPIQDALGLAWQETKFGRMPYYNDSSMGNDGYTETDLENSNYFKNYGSIPAEYLVRDFRYNGDLIYNGRRDNPIPLSTPPLQHALEYYKSGKYNTGDKNHTSDVKASGKRVWNEITGTLRDWWNKEGIKWYNSSK